MTKIRLLKRKTSNEQDIDAEVSAVEHSVLDKIEHRRERQRKQKASKEKIKGIEATRFQEGNISGRHIGTPIEVNWSAVDKLLHIQCTLDEVAGFLGMGIDTLKRRCRQDHDMTWTEYRKSKQAGGRASLRRKQWLLADNNAAVSIFLGKQYLGQTDKIQADVNTKSETTVKLQKLDQSDLVTLENLLLKSTLKKTDQDNEGDE